MTKNIDLSALVLPSLPSHDSKTIGALLWAREILQQHLTATYAVKDPKGIEELKPVKIGGVDQWLHIRGRNRHNPVLVYLHGGQGCPNIGFFDAIQRPWEDYFTIVQWDQRQTGKSYYPADDDNAPLSVDRFVEDTAEVIQYLRRHLEQEKLFVLGHSWGSVLGMHMVKRHPDWIHAYIGVGQVVNMMDSERVLYERVLAHAKQQKENQLLDSLKSIAPYPDLDNPDRSFADHSDFVRYELSRLAGEAGMHHLPLDSLVNMLRIDSLISPHLTLTDIANATIGDERALFRTGYRFAKEFMAIDLPNDVGSSFEVPILFFSGRHDYQTPVTLSNQWFNEINAPYKELIHFEESSHLIVNEEPGRVLTALVNKVLPFAKGRTALETKGRNVSAA